MLSVRDAMLYALDRTRAITGPGVIDIRPSSAQIITRVWTGGRRGEGSFTEAPKLTLPNFVAVRHVSQREVAGSGGLYELGDVRVGRITPRYTAPDGSLGGFTPLEIAPSRVSPGVSCPPFTPWLRPIL